MKKALPVLIVLVLVALGVPWDQAIEVVDDAPAAEAPVTEAPGTPRPVASQPVARPRVSVGVSAADALRADPVPGAVCGTRPRVLAANDDALQALAVREGVDHPDAFASVVATVRATGELPGCYLTKAQAEAAGWRRGTALWDAVPGGAIGGGHFGNYEGLLPAGGSYVEADLDDDGGRRGAHRLVVDASDRPPRLWLTTDHYRSFVEVP